MRRFVIGDIHGAHKALQQCIKRSKLDVENDELIVLGDVADGWPFVIDCILELSKVKNAVFLLGNHDKWYYDFLLYGSMPNIWTSQGGSATLTDYDGNVGKKISHDELRSFFGACKPFYISDRNELFVHGGYPKGTTFADGKFNGHVQDLYWDRSLVETAMLKTMSVSHSKMNTWFDDFDTIYVGHTAIKPTVFRAYQNVYDMDTGAGWSGTLTIMDVDTKEYWMSDNVLELYPNVAGRARSR